MMIRSLLFSACAIGCSAADNGAPGPNPTTAKVGPGCKPSRWTQNGHDVIVIGITHEYRDPVSERFSWRCDVRVDGQSLNISLGSDGLYSTMALPYVSPMPLTEVVSALLSNYPSDFDARRR
jgi:hypothetical protein